MTILHRRSILAALAVCGGLSPVWADPGSPDASPAERLLPLLPENLVAVAVTDGADSLQTAFEASSLGK